MHKKKREDSFLAPGEKLKYSNVYLLKQGTHWPVSGLFEHETQMLEEKGMILSLLSGNLIERASCGE